MESPRKFNDCYFYYYSTCTKGDNCVFRHEPSALGCETMCSAWQQGKCLDKRCKLRHMELRKNRKQIPCYWENQPGGCRKKHCPFMHKNPEARTDGIAPSQPGPPMPVQVPGVPAPLPAGVEVTERPLPANVAPPPAPMPLLWQQQRQLVLDSALLGVLPGSAGGAIVARRTITGVEEAGPYALSAVDPLVVNFEEESDNESAPSSTPTKCQPDDAQRIARTKSQELLLLEKIQAEAAAFYNYEHLPAAPEPPKERKIVRTNTKYERLSLDEITGKPATTERRKSLDFKVLSLDEIRARKKTIETVVPTAPITLKLSRKRKSSTTETITTTGNKILKVVRSNSIVYKKIDKNAPTPSSQTKQDHKPQGNESRKRTLSEQTDLIYDMQEDELVDNCFEFKRIKLTEQNTMKPVIIRNKQSSVDRVDIAPCDEADVSSKADIDSDSEVQIVSVVVDIHNEVTSIDDEVIDLDDSKTSDIDDVVDLSEDVDETANSSRDFIENVPDVVASCQKNGTIGVESTVSDIDEDVLLNDDDDL